MQAVVGLGNPGKRYADTRHNLGFRVVDLIAGARGAGWRGTPSFLIASAGCDSGPMVLVKPMTSMNRSGSAVATVLDRFEVSRADMLVVVDDVNLEPGCVRFRRKGSDGGHRGLRSIAKSLGDAEFPRLRLGVGMPPEGIDMIDHVLGGFDEKEAGLVDTMVRAAADGVACWSTLGLDVAMNRFNTVEVQESQVLSKGGTV